MIVNDSLAVKSLVLNVLYRETSTRINIMVPYVLNFLSSVSLNFSVPLSPKYSELQKPLVLILDSENIVIRVNNQEIYIYIYIYSFPPKRDIK